MCTFPYCKSGLHCFCWTDGHKNESNFHHHGFGTMADTGINDSNTDLNASKKRKKMKQYRVAEGGGDTGDMVGMLTSNDSIHIEGIDKGNNTQWMSLEEDEDDEDDEFDQEFDDIDKLMDTPMGKEEQNNENIGKEEFVVNGNDNDDDDDNVITVGDDVITNDEDLGIEDDIDDIDNNIKYDQQEDDENDDQYQDDEVEDDEEQHDDIDTKGFIDHHESDDDELDMEIETMQWIICYVY